MAQLGIDYGTSTTIAALANDNRVAVMTNLGGELVVPSTVAYPPGGGFLVGREADARRIIDPTNTLYSVKRAIGRPWDSEELRRFRKEYPFEFACGSDDRVRFVTRAGRLSAVDVVARMLASIRDYPAFGREAISKVVITSPASFGPSQSAALLEAVRQAGYREAAVVDEPRAAALPYLAESEARDELVAIYDLGGGTFDFAVLRCRGPRSETVAVGGDAYLGGDDIDLELAHWLAGEILEKHRWDVRTRPASFQALRMACERAKIQLSTVETTHLDLGEVDLALSGRSVTLERQQLEKLFFSLVQRTFIVCDEVLARAGVDAAKVDRVILAGGGAFIPAVQRMVERYFRKEPLLRIRPDHLVAMGAALSHE